MPCSDSSMSETSLVWTDHPRHGTMWLTEGITGRPAARNRALRWAAALLLGLADLVVSFSQRRTPRRRPPGAGGSEVVKMKPEA